MGRKGTGYGAQKGGMGHRKEAPTATIHYICGMKACHYRGHGRIAAMGQGKAPLGLWTLTLTL